MEFLKTVEATTSKPYHEALDGKHLIMRDDQGLSTTKPYNNKPMPLPFTFIYFLFKDSNPAEAGSFSEYIFEKWCQVAYAASFPVKESYSVKARFWKFPTFQATETITFYYHPPDRLQAKFNYLEEFQDEIAIDLCQKLQNINVAMGFWSELVEAAHKAAFENTFGVNGNLTILTDYQGGGDYCLGNHPQGFYSVWVSALDKDKLTNRGYLIKQDQRDMPLPTGVFDKIELPNGSASVINGTCVETVTTINENKMKTAAIVPRCQSQNYVMGGVGAPAVAKKLKWVGTDTGRTAEVGLGSPINF
ncbi:hypothetical protein ABW20_dc0103081 [Dactylellina cionopaga]|nr:hypothetical protein ABW20_dc0103081 [Dactylellina cionopaga]